MVAAAAVILPAVAGAALAATWCFIAFHSTLARAHADTQRSRNQLAVVQHQLADLQAHSLTTPCRQALRVAGLDLKVLVHDDKIGRRAVAQGRAGAPRSAFSYDASRHAAVSVLGFYTAEAACLGVN